MASQADLVASLTMEEVPVKLRCAACNRLAIEAFRMPCCDQSICEDCQIALPQACPVCLHEPVQKEDCRPNKALRITVKAFLKRKTIEAENARKKEMTSQAKSESADGPAAVQSAGRNAVGDAEMSKPANEGESGNANNARSDAKPTTPAVQTASTSGTQVSVEPHPSSSGNALASSGVSNEGHSIKSNSKPQNQSLANIGQPAEQWNQANGGMQANANFGHTNGAYPNMNNMGQMGGVEANGMNEFGQMMPYMSGGMPNDMMGSMPNMMGMGMDPMAMSQGFYGGYGGSNMGMNMMNMGMGFDAGQGNNFGGFNGGQPQAQAYGQYDENYGANAGTGYGGYNNMPQQGNFNQMHHHHQNFNQDFSRGGHHQQASQYRGRGRGRAGYPFAGRGRGYSQTFPGRPSYQPANPQNQTSGPNARQSFASNALSKPDAEQDPQMTEPGVEEPEAQKIIEEQLRKEFAPGGAEDEVDDRQTERPTGPDTQGSMTENPAIESQTVREIDSTLARGDLSGTQHESPLKSEKVDVGENSAVAVVSSPTMLPPTQRIPTGPARDRRIVHGANIQTAHQSARELPPSSSHSESQSPATRYEPITDFSSTSGADKVIQPPKEPKGLGVQGAPTGPKALRQNLPTAGVKSTQEPGFSIVGLASSFSQDRPEISRRPQSPRSPRSQSRSRSRSRSLSRHRSEHRRHQEHRSRSPSRERSSNRRHEHRERDRSKRDGDNRFDELGRHESHRKVQDDDRSAHRHSSHGSSRDIKASSRSKHRSRRSARDRSRSLVRNKRHEDRQRSESPDFRINGTSKVESAYEGSRLAVQDHLDASRHHMSRKRREKDMDEDYSSRHGHHHRERKRSRRNEDGADHQDDYGRDDARTHVSRRDPDGKQNRGDSRREDRQANGTTHADRRASHTSRHRMERPSNDRIEEKQTSAAPKAPKVDQHALEREARNRERQMKEIQRRAIMEGGGGGGGGGGSRAGKTSSRESEHGSHRSRRHSQRYEDEENDLASRVEREREGGRWR